MYSLRFSKTYGFGIMEKNKLQQVIEDRYYADDKIFCVADGVTRDYKDGTPLEYPQNIEDAKKIMKKYPNPSGAAKAAEICVADLVKCLKNKSVQKNFKYAIGLANEDIKKINAGRKINYVAEDDYCCVAAGGLIENDQLFCFSIGDSGIKVLDDDCNIIFDSEAYLKDDADLLTRLMDKVFTWKDNCYRKYIRKHLRNNVWLKNIGKCNVGVLDGSEEAVEFLITYQVSLKNAKYILAYSDGCSESLDTKEKLKEVIENPEKIKETIPEKTLIVYEKK